MRQGIRDRAPGTGLAALPGPQDTVIGGPGPGVRTPVSNVSSVVGATGGGRLGWGRSTRKPEPQAGFTMAAVLVIMAVMAILLTVAVETVSFQQKREKEQELIFRGNQIVEAIRLFRARNGRFPMTLSELVNAKPRVLRKVWTDPMTGVADWEPVFVGEEGTNVGPGLAPPPTPTPGIGGPAQGGAKTGPIIGVHSRSCADSIMILNGRTRYCDWKFYFDPAHPFGAQVGGPAPVVAPGK
jgi:type II secretory pathway pseudopilin PulG